MNVTPPPTPILIDRQWFIETSRGVIVGPYDSEDDARARAQQLIDEDRRREALAHKGRHLPEASA